MTDEPKATPKFGRCDNCGNRQNLMPHDPLGMICGACLAQSKHAEKVAELEALLLAERQKVERMEKALRWVSVDEQMPKQGKMVLAYFKNENGCSRRIRAMWAPKFGIVDEGDYQGDSEYDEKTDECYWPEGWYEANEFEETNWLVMEDVTHWMPLPDPPVAALAKETT